MVDIILKLILLLSPIAYGAKINFDKFDLRFFEIGVMALFVGSLFDTPKREIKDFKYPIFWLMGLITINSFWHRFQPLDIRAVESLFFGILAFYIVTRYLKDPQGCFKYIWWALGINIAIMIFQKIGYTPIVRFTTVQGYGAFVGCEGGMLGNISRFCIYLAIILPFIYLPVALALAFTFGYCMHYAQISVFIPIALMLFCRIEKKIYRYVFAVLGICSAVFLHKKIIISILLRWNEVWKITIDRIFERPLLGWGLGNYQLWISKESFNSYLPFIYGLGLLGAVWAGFSIKLFIKSFNGDKESIAVAGLLLVSLIEYPFEIPRLWFTIIAIFSFFAIKAIEKGGLHGKGKSYIQGT